MGKLRNAYKAVFHPEQWSGESSALYTGSSGGYQPWIFRSNALFSSYAKIYRNSLPVRAVVSYLADNMAAIPLHGYKRVEKAIREELVEHDLEDFLRDPHPEMTQHELTRDMVTDLLIFDVFLFRKIRVGKKLYLRRMYPDAVTPIGGNSMAPEAFEEIQMDGTTKTFDRDDVFWMHGYGGAMGISAMETLRREIELDEAEADYRLRSAKKGWRTAGVIQRPKAAGPWTDTARERFLEVIGNRYSGDGDLAGRPLLLEEDMTWVSDVDEKGQEQYVGARTLTWKQVLGAFQMTPQMFGIEGAPYSSIIAYFNQLYQAVLAPKMSFIEQGYNKYIVPEFEDSKSVYVEFNIGAKLRGDPLTQAQIAVSAVGGPTHTADEWRASVHNLGPLPDGAGAKIYSPAAVGPPGPPPTSGMSDAPVPSDFALSATVTSAKAEVPGEDIVHIRDKFKIETEGGFDRVFDGIQKEYQKKSSFDKSLWSKSLAGEIHFQTLSVSRAVGEYAAGRMGGTYDSGVTDNYWAKVSGAQAKSTMDMLEDALKDTEDADLVFARAKSQFRDVAETLVTGASNWAVLELGRQIGRTDGLEEFQTKAVTLEQREVPPEVNVTVNIPPIELPAVTFQPPVINVEQPALTVEAPNVTITPELEVNLPQSQVTVSPADVVVEKSGRRVQRVIRDENNLITSIITEEE